MHRKHEKYITVAYAAELAGVSLPTMRKWLENKLIPNAFKCQRAHGAHWMIPMSGVPAKPTPGCIFCGKRITGTRYLAKSKYCGHLCKRLHFYYKRKGMPHMRKQHLKPRKAHRTPGRQILKE